MPARPSIARAVFASLLLTLGTAAAAVGQAGPGGGFGGGPGGPGGGPPNPQEMRQMMEDRMKDQLDVTDDEYAKLAPMIDKVRKLQRDANARFDARQLMRPDSGGNRGGRDGDGNDNGGGGGGNDRPGRNGQAAGPDNGPPDLGVPDNGGPDNGGGGPGGPGGGFGGPPEERSNEPLTPVQTALKDLRALTQQKEVSADTVQSKLKVLRDARAKAKTDLSAAQDELRKAVNVRQEVVLITLGLLE